MCVKEALLSIYWLWGACRNLSATWTHLKAHGKVLNLLVHVLFFLQSNCCFVQPGETRGSRLMKGHFDCWRDPEAGESIRIKAGNDHINNSYKIHHYTTKDSWVQPCAIDSSVLLSVPLPFQPDQKSGGFPQKFNCLTEAVLILHRINKDWVQVKRDLQFKSQWLSEECRFRPQNSPQRHQLLSDKGPQLSPGL